MAHGSLLVVWGTLTCRDGAGCGRLMIDLIVDMEAGDGARRGMGGERGMVFGVRAISLTVLAVSVFTAAACNGGESTTSADGSGSSADGDPVHGNSSTSGSVSDGDGPSAGAGRGSAEDDTAAGADTGGTLVAPLGPVVDEPSDAPASPEAGGTLRVAVVGESDGLNPAANNLSASSYTMVLPVLEPLAYWDDNGEWAPYLAESFTKIGDGSLWQMKLREGVRFHDSSELDADDVIATFRAQLSDPVISRVLKPSFLDDAVEKIDDYTVQYNLKSPIALLPTLLTGQFGMVLPSEWVARASQDRTLNQMPVGTGPFMVENRVHDEVTVLVRNPDYWASDTTDVYLDRIEVYPIPDSVVAARRVDAGDIDMMITTVSEAILIMRDAENVKTIENSRASEIFVLLNAGRAPFDDIRARQALTFATPKNAYNTLIGENVSIPADTMFHPDLVWHNSDIVQETDMPERAGPLVEAYCRDHSDHCTNGRIDMEFQHTGPSVSMARSADLLIDGWRDYFNVTIQELPSDDYILQVALGQFNASMWRHFGAIDPSGESIWLSCFTIGVVSLNWSRYCEEDRDELMREQRSIDDLDRRVEIWNEVQHSIRDSYVYIFLSHVNFTIGARDNVHNICGQVAPGTGTVMFCNNAGRVLLSQIWLS